MRVLPELQYEDARADEAVALIERYGCVLLRGAISSNLLAVYYEAAKAAYAVRDWQYAHGELETVLPLAAYHSGTINVHDIDPPGAPRDTAIVELVQQSALAQIHKRLFGPKIALPINACVLRRQGVARNLPPVPYHQDQGFYPEFMGIADGHAHRVVNAWIPFVACGENAPGLEVYPEKLDGLMHALGRGAGTTGLYDYIEIGDETLYAHIDREKLWTPVYAPGDMMLMTNHTLHRTHMTSAMKDERISLEIRAVSLKAPIKGSAVMVALN